MEVRHGSLVNVFGKPARSESYTFMPADVELDGSSFVLDYRLADHFLGSIPPVLCVPIEQGFDAAWVRARIPALFGHTPVPAEIEKTLLYSGFVAVIELEQVCYPFVCSDHYGESALMFSSAGPEEAIKRGIAEEFWEALVQNPEELFDFEERIYHEGASLWRNFGCNSGHLYCDESEE